MVVLGAIEALERRDLSDDRTGEDVRGIELRNIRVGDALLVVVDKKDGGAIRGSNVRPLAVELRRIMRHREEDAEKLSVGDVRRIVGNFDGFGVARGLGRDLIVGRGRGRAAGIARSRLDDSLETLKDGLNTPEAPPAKTAFSAPGCEASAASIAAAGIGGRGAAWRAQAVNETMMPKTGKERRGRLSIAGTSRQLQWDARGRLKDTRNLVQGD